jgi:pSer/pThr/pTyr-binding forkhead associated (FHA) protein
MASVKPAAYGGLALVRSDGKDVKTMTLRKEVYRLGRAVGCEVRLRVEGVEPEHAQITHDMATGTTQLHSLIKDKPVAIVAADGSLVTVDVGTPHTLSFGTTFQVSSKRFLFNPPPPPLLPSSAEQDPLSLKHKPPEEHPRASKSKKRKAEEGNDEAATTPVIAVAPAATAVTTSSSNTIAANAPTGMVLRFSRGGSQAIDALDVASVTDVCRRFHLQHSALNSLVQGETTMFRNWSYHGVFDAATKQPRPDAKPVFLPVVPRRSNDT